MKFWKYLVLLAGLSLMAGCGDHPSDGAEHSADANESSDGHGMVLPATTSSDAALQSYTAGWADFENSRFATAHEHFQAAAEADGNFAMAHLMAALSGASTESFISNLREASADADEASQGEQLLIRAFELALAADAEGRIAALTELTEIHPDSPRAWVFLGNAYANINSSGEARTAYETAIELDASLVPARINLGTNLMSQNPKDFAAAEAQFMEAVAITPDEPNPHDLLGDVHRAQNNLQAAYDDYTRAAELAPELGSGYQQRGHVNSFLGNYEEARADYARAAELEDARGTNAGGFFLVFSCYVPAHQGDLDTAIAELRALAAGADEAYTEGVADLKVNALNSAALFAIEARDADAASEIIAEMAGIMREQAEDVGSDDVRDAQEATIAYMEGLLAARMGDAEAAEASAAAFEGYVASSTNPRAMERMHEIAGMTAYYQGDYGAAVYQLSRGDHLNNMYTKYFLARANEEAGNAEEAARLYDELAVWNFNGPGYAMYRSDIMERAAAT